MKKKKRNNPYGDLLWMDGRFVRTESASVPVLSHSLHYGSAAFEGIRAYETDRGAAVFRLKDHVDRLFHSARTLGMRLPFSRAEIARAIKGIVRKNKLSSCYIRPIAYFKESMGLVPAKDTAVCVAIAAWEWGRYLKKDAVSVAFSPYVRIHPHSTDTTAKIAGHYVNSTLASARAKKEGADEALLLDYRGYVAEGPGENIFFVKGRTLYTPKEGAILPGITRKTIMELARDKGMRVAEKDIAPKDIPSFSEAFFTGTAAEVNAIGRIGNTVFSGGKEGEVTRMLREAYADCVRGNIAKYRKWCDFVQPSL